MLVDYFLASDLLKEMESPHPEMRISKRTPNACVVDLAKNFQRAAILIDTAFSDAIGAKQLIETGNAQKETAFHVRISRSHV
jgi:hypothetical protein